MTLWIENTDEETLKNRLGKEVYEFLMTCTNNRDYLYDYRYLFTKVKPTAKDWQLSDYSPFVLHVCKFFENSLFLICEKLGLINKLCKGKKLYSLRGFFNNNREKIQKHIEGKIKNKRQATVVLDKLFATVEDYEQRNKAIHPGKLLKYAEIENYDSIITKLKELVELLLDHKLLKISKRKDKKKNLELKKIKKDIEYRLENTELQKHREHLKLLREKNSEIQIHPIYPKESADSKFWVTEIKDDIVKVTKIDSGHFFDFEISVIEAINPEGVGATILLSPPWKIVWYQKGSRLKDGFWKLSS